MRILLITNDSTVFLHRKGDAGSIFGGRFTEVRNLRNRLENHDVSFKIITGVGIFNENDIISEYSEITDSEKKYIELQKRIDLAASIRSAGSYDLTIVLVPKGMMKILIENDALHGNVIAVTSNDLIKTFREKGWYHLERRGARIGRENAERIIQTISSLSFL